VPVHEKQPVAQAVHVDPTNKYPFEQESTHELPSRYIPVAQVTQVFIVPEQVLQFELQSKHSLPLSIVDPEVQVDTQVFL
jgi:hypothetical protein